MSDRPVASAAELNEVPLSLGEGWGKALVWKPFEAEVWERDFDTPTSDTGATQLLTGEDFTDRDLLDVTTLAAITVPVS